MSVAKKRKTEEASSEDNEDDDDDGSPASTHSDIDYHPDTDPGSISEIDLNSSSDSEVSDAIMNDQSESTDTNQSGSTSTVETTSINTSTSITTSKSKSKPGKGKGKPKDPIWSCFTEKSVVHSNGNITKLQECNICGAKVSGQAPRMKKHYESLNCQRNLAGKSKNKNSSTPATATTAFPSAETSLSGSGSSPTHTRIQSKMSGFINKISSMTKEQLDGKAARFWYGANLAFNVANLNVWKDFCSSLNSAYNPPSEYDLQGRLLDQTYAELHQKMEEDLKGHLVILVQDGWSDIHRYPVLTHTVICNGEAYLLNCIECQENEKTAEYCAAQFEDALRLLETMDCKIIGGTTDNCNVMVKMREILLDKYPDLFLYGCSPHMLNLLCEDITPKALTAKVNQVSKFFRDHHSPAALLKQKGGVIPQLPATTRWSSHLECVRIFLKNRLIYIEISQMEGVCPNDITETVNSLAIYRTAQDLLTQFEEITCQILKLQSDRSNVADAMHSWLTLRNSKNLKQYKNNIERRMERAISDFFLVAYLLHPKYKGQLLSTAQRDTAFDYLLNKSAIFNSIPGNEEAETFVTMAQAFLALDSAIFPKSSLNEKVMTESNPANWWLNLRNRKSELTGLIDLIVPMYSCPASVASVERIFSTYGFIQTDKRNRLTQDKVMKLSFCFRALRKEDASRVRQRNVLSKATK